MEITFEPCWCAHEKTIAPIIRELGGIEKARSRVYDCLRRCPLARGWSNGMCAHLSLFNRPENNPKKIIAWIFRKKFAESQENTEVRGLYNSFVRIFSLINTLDIIRGAEQWREFALSDFRSWEQDISDKITLAGYSKNEVFVKMCQELLEILLVDVVCHIPGDTDRTSESRERFDELMLSIHAILARDLNLLWLATQALSVKSEQ